ncbi:MAG: hypothetical protein A3G17_05440 [Planctomycetes bacterium RIFCSPLOWO2_12_FULL_50_35]|nr:MAG: hypothetical protein A3G17_05440 [Planctomycetes bacterium RIFCSPLOWO2_12_FULL_50_35]
MLGLQSHVVDKILDLTEEYALSRYPDISLEVPYLEYDKETAERKVNIAKEVFQTLKNRYKGMVD